MEKKQLGNLVTIDSGYAFKSNLFNNDKNGIPIIRIRDISSGEISTYYSGKYDRKYIVNDDDLLIGMDGNFTIRKWNCGEALLNQRVCRVKSINKDLLLDEYLYRILPVELKKIEDKTPFVTVKHLSVKDINQIEIDLPDIKIQQKIVNLLNKAEELINRRKKQIGALDELVKSRFIEMFGNPVTNSKGWDIKELGTLGYFKNGMNYKQSDSGFKIKFLGVGEFKYGNTMNSSNMLPTLELQEEPNEEYLLKKGDIIFVRSNGSKELVGRSILVRELEEKTTYSGFCIRYRNQCEEVIPDFLIQLFLDGNFKKAFKQDSRGANINNLNQQMLSVLKIIIPPIQLQNEFADFVNQVDKLKFEMEESLKELEDNFNSLMQKSFKGELFN